MLERERRRILAAEDNSLNRLVLEDMLTHLQAEVTFAVNGREAVELVRARGGGEFDVVLMDVQMPVMDGYAATRSINALAPGLPVIGLTAHALPEEEQRCLSAGMVARITKPVDPHQITSAIHKYLKMTDRQNRPAAAS